MRREWPGTGRVGPAVTQRTRRNMVIAGLLSSVLLMVTSCSASDDAQVAVAPSTATNERVEPVGFDAYEISSAIGDVVIPTEPPTTTIVSETSAPTLPATASSVVAATTPAPAPTPAPVPPPAPVTTPPAEPIPAPAVAAPVATAPRTTPATAPKATPKPAAAPVARSTTPATTRAQEPSPPTSASPTPSANPATTLVVTPKVGATCTRALQDSTKTRADGSVVECQRKNGKRTWVLVSRATIPSPTAATLSRAPGFDGRTIRVGILSTTTHPVWGTIGKALKAGLEARVATINRRGGIAGKYRIELVYADTNYDPGLTATQLNATKDSVVGYAQILGTPNVEAVEPLLKQNQMLASPASQEARWATSANLMPIGNNYQVQAINGISYFLEQNAQAPTPAAGTRPKVCAASVATSYGEAGSEGFRFAQEKLGFDAGPIVSVGAIDTNMAPFSLQLRNAGCAAVMVTVGPAQTLGLVVSGRQQGFSPRWIIMGASFSEKIVVPVTGPLFEQGAWVVGDGTQWGDASVIGMPTVRNELIAADHRFWTENPDVGLTYGYVQGRVMEATLEKAVALGDLSHQGLLNASRQIGTVDTLGLTSPIDYSQPSRLANARTTIFAVDASYQNAIKVLARDYTSPTAQAYKK